MEKSIAPELLKSHWDYVGGLEETLIQIEEVVKTFFSMPANQSNFTDYMECYETLGKIKDIMGITIDTSDSRIKEVSE